MKKLTIYQELKNVPETLYEESIESTIDSNDCSNKRSKTKSLMIVPVPVPSVTDLIVLQPPATKCLIPVTPSSLASASTSVILGDDCVKESLKDLALKDLAFDLKESELDNWLSTVLTKEGSPQSNQSNKVDKVYTFKLTKKLKVVVGKVNKDPKTEEVKEINLEFETGVSTEEILSDIKVILSDLESVTKRGFIVPKDLLFKNIPLMNTLASHFCDMDLLKQTVGDIDSEHFKESYGWMYNFILLNLHRLMHSHMHENKIDYREEALDSDVLSDYKYLLNKLYSKLDPSIRLKLSRPGLGIIQNIYTGFDTEYQNKDSKHNELISVQIAANTRTHLKIPMLEDYSVCTIDAQSNKKYPVKRIEGFNYTLFEDSVNYCIREIRYIKYSKYDKMIDILNKGFKCLCIKRPELFKSFKKGDYLVVSLPRTPVEKFLFIDENKTGFKFDDVVNISGNLVNKHLDDDYKRIRWVINNIRKLYDESLTKEVGDIFMTSEIGIDPVENLKVLSQIPSLIMTEDSKRYSRSKLRSLEMNINRVKNNYIISHLTNADLSMLKDFDTLKESLDIVNRSFVTLGKPLKVGGFNVHIRDTMLLAPAGKKGLSALGDLLGFNKLELSQVDLQSMSLLLLNDREKFIKYAITDAIITLLYANYMEDELFKSRGLGIPLSLSSLSATYVLDEWERTGYKGYQIHPQYLLGDTGATQTPKGLAQVGDVGRKIGLYISNYRGGRNESYMYGVDNDRIWYDYDLVSAYTTAMILLGNPDYSSARNLSEDELKKMSSNDLILNYLVMVVKFEFPKSVKYPSIPCNLDENTTIYPLQGEAVLTGIEYLLAKEQGCVFSEIKDIYLIPFERVKREREEEDLDNSVSELKLLKNQPFKYIIIYLQKQRSKYPKRSLGNLMEKEKGNSIYGNVVRGMSNKKKFDIKTGRTLRMEGGVLTNPIVASWITAFIRSVVGECLHLIQNLEGSVVSATTDGFITNVENLEGKLIDPKFKGSNSLILMYREARSIVSIGGVEDALEIKKSGRGIISWTTRGQFSLDSTISASTGLQTKGLSLENLDYLFKNTMAGEDRIIEYIQTSLRSAKELYTHGGHVTKTYADRIVKLEYDNKRIIDLPDTLENTRDFSNILLDSSPALNKNSVDGLRYLNSVHKRSAYSKITSVPGNSKYRSYEDLAIRNFIKSILKDPPSHGLESFESYSDLIEFIREYKPSYKVSKSSLSNLKARKVVIKGVPRTPETLAFAGYLEIRFKSFDKKAFFEK